MADADVTDEQLKKSNEPEFTGALKVKRHGQGAFCEGAGGVPRQRAARCSARAARRRRAEAGTCGACRARRRGARQGGRHKGGQVRGREEAGEGRVGHPGDLRQDQGRRHEDARRARREGQRGVHEGEGAPARSSRSTSTRDEGVQGRALQRAARQGRWIKDKFAGMPDEVNRFYEQGKTTYLARWTA